MGNLTDQLESVFFNRVLPLLFKGLEYILLATLLYGGVMTVVNSIGELF